MADLEQATAALAAVQKQVDAAHKANMKLAERELTERNDALQAAAKAGLSVDAGALQPLGHADAHRRFLTLIALLADCQTQVGQIVLLTSTNT